MSASAETLAVALEDLAVVCEELLGRAVAKKWALVHMDMTRLGRIVEEEEVLVTECRAAEQRRQTATRDLLRALGGADVRPVSEPLPALSDLARRVSAPTLRERLLGLGARLRAVLAMMRRAVAANREIILGSIKHFERFFRVIQRANAPAAMVYNRQGAVAVRDPVIDERALRFVDQRV
jgi:hypothetical protein